MKDEVIILIPSYEPDDKLIKVVNELFDYQFSILVINDGSSDKYEIIFEQIKNKAKYIKLPFNKGKGEALKEGYKNILSLFPQAKYVITVDGDGQHATKDIVKVSELLIAQNECVLGIRKFNKSVPFRSRFGNYYSQFTRSLTTKTYLEDDQCGLRGFPIRYIPELLKIHGSRYDYEINQLADFEIKNYPIITTPISLIYEEDNNQKTHFQNFRDTSRIQIKIAYQGLPSLISLTMLIASLIVLYAFGYTYHHLIIFPAYLTSSLLTIGIWTITHPSKKPINRIIKELMFTIVKMTTVFTLSFLLIDALKVPYFIALPLLILLSCLYNFLLPKIIKNG